jgi:hypothetical protein
MRSLVIALACTACGSTAPKLTETLNGQWQGTGPGWSVTMNVTDANGRITGTSTDGAVTGTHTGDSVHVVFGGATCGYIGVFSSDTEVDGDVQVQANGGGGCYVLGFTYKLIRQ